MDLKNTNYVRACDVPRDKIDDYPPNTIFTLGGIEEDNYYPEEEIDDDDFTIVN